MLHDGDADVLLALLIRTRSRTLCYCCGGVGVAAMAVKVGIYAYRAYSAVSKVRKVTKVVRSVGKAVKSNTAVKKRLTSYKAPAKKPSRIKKSPRQNRWSKDVVDHWDRGAFPNRLQSIKWHHAKHGKPGQSMKDHARQGVRLSKKVGATGKRVVVRGPGGGIVSRAGRTFTTW